MNSGDEPDEWLMSLVACGDRECLNVLLRRYATPLLTYIRRTVGDRHRSEELFQDIFLAVWSNSRQYQYPRSFKAWLFGIAVNKCRADCRKQSFWWKRVATEPPGELVSTAASPGDATIAAERATLVTQAVAALPESQRTVLVLRIWNELSYPEIAAIIGRTESTVRSHMFHALAAVRQFLEPRMQ